MLLGKNLARGGVIEELSFSSAQGTVARCVRNRSLTHYSLYRVYDVVNYSE